MESTSRAVPDLGLPAAEPLLWLPALLESRDESLSRSCRLGPDELPIPPGELPIPLEELPIPDELLLELLEGVNPPPPLWLLLEEELAGLELLDGLGDALWLAPLAEEELGEMLGELIGVLCVAGAAEAAGERCA